MQSKLFLLVVLSVFCIWGIASAQTPPPQHEEITLTTYYPAPYGDYAQLTVSGAMDLGPALEVTPTLTATANNDILTAVRINPTFNDAGYSGVRHNGLIVQNGNVGIGTTSPDLPLDLNGALSVRGIPTASAPAAAPADQGRIYFNSDSDQFMASESGGAYAPLVGGGALKIATNHNNPGGHTGDLSVASGQTVTINVPGINVKYVILGGGFNHHSWLGRHGIRVTEVGNGYFKVHNYDVHGETVMSWMAIGN